jgi:hypothetical protein
MPDSHSLLQAESKCCCTNLQPGRNCPRTLIGSSDLRTRAYLGVGSGLADLRPPSSPGESPFRRSWSGGAVVSEALFLLFLPPLWCAVFPVFVVELFLLRSAVCFSLPVCARTLPVSVPANNKQVMKATMLFFILLFLSNVLA